MAITLQGVGNKNSFSTPEQKKQKKMLIILGIILVAIAAVIYFGYFGKTEPQPSAELPAGVNVAVSSESNESLMKTIKDVKIDNLIYQDKRFMELVMHGELPVVAGEKGRSDPFASF